MEIILYIYLRNYKYQKEDLDYVLSKIEIPKLIVNVMLKTDWTVGYLKWLLVNDKIKQLSHLNRQIKSQHLSKIGKLKQLFTSTYHGTKLTSYTRSVPRIIEFESFMNESINLFNRLAIVNPYESMKNKKYLI